MTGPTTNNNFEFHNKLILKKVGKLYKKRMFVCVCEREKESEWEIEKEKEKREKEIERDIIGRLEWTFVAIDSVMMFSSFLQTNKPRICNNA